MKLSKRSWVAISGVTWLLIGVMLLVKGLKFVIGVAEGAQGAAPLLHWLESMAGSKQQAALLVISVALLIGLIKGRTVLAQTVHRITARIDAQTAPIAFAEAYDRKYYIVLGCMVGIGLLFRFLPIPLDIRGGIDVAIGSALINGALLYFRKLI